MTKKERKKYIAAVQCLGKLEAKTPLSEAPGVRRRYDDFVATHIQQTFSVHNTGNFLGWHRFLTWTYEQPSETSVDTMATSHTTTGLSGPPILLHRLLSMEVKPA